MSTQSGSGLLVGSGSSVSPVGSVALPCVALVSVAPVSSSLSLTPPGPPVLRPRVPPSVGSVMPPVGVDPLGLVVNGLAPPEMPPSPAAHAPTSSAARTGSAPPRLLAHE
jgi:hypothetical protein